MRLHLKVIAAALSAALVVSAMPAPASAQQQQQQGVGILPTLFGPFGAHLIAGPATTTFSWITTSTLTSKIWVPGKWIWTKTGYKWKLVKFGNKWSWIKSPKFEKVYIRGHKEFVHNKVDTKHSRSSKSIQGKVIVGCIFGSALATIWSAARKGSAMGNPLRWRSQAEHERILASGVEKKYELTLDEANRAMAFCGLGSFTLNWPQS